MFQETVIARDNGTPRTKHVTTNVIAEVDEAAGTALVFHAYCSAARLASPVHRERPVGRPLRATRQAVTFR
jgi:hypothetical protein